MSGIVMERKCITCEAIFSEDKKHRYLLKKTWNESKPYACVIMFNPHFSDCLRTDTTTNKVMNYLLGIEDKDYGGIYFMNLYSIMTSDKDAVKNDFKTKIPKECDEYLRKAIEGSQDIFLAWGVDKDNIERIGELKQIIKIKNINADIYRLLVEYDGQLKPYHPSRYSIKSHDKITDNFLA